eukprot:5203140-Amphidinium_carterae.2
MSRNLFATFRALCWVDHKPWVKAISFQCIEKHYVKIPVKPPSIPMFDVARAGKSVSIDR